MKIIELKSTIIKLKNNNKLPKKKKKKPLLYGLSSKMIITEDKISNLYANRQNSSNLNNRLREYHLKKINQSPRACETVTRFIIHTISAPRGKEKERRLEKYVKTYQLKISYTWPKVQYFYRFNKLNKPKAG